MMWQHSKHMDEKADGTRNDFVEGRHTRTHHMFGNGRGDCTPQERRKTLSMRSLLPWRMKQKTLASQTACLKTKDKMYLESDERTKKKKRKGRSESDNSTKMEGISLH